MGNGFRALRVNLDKRILSDKRVRFSDDNALLLAGSRFLNPELDRTDSKNPDGKLSIVNRVSPENCMIKLSASDDKSLSAAVFFDAVRGSVVGSRQLSGKSQEIELALPLRPESATGKLKLSVQIIDGGGNIRQVETEAQ